MAPDDSGGSVRAHTAYFRSRRVITRMQRTQVELLPLLNQSQSTRAGEQGYGKEKRRERTKRKKKMCVCVGVGVKQPRGKEELEFRERPSQLFALCETCVRVLGAGVLFWNGLLALMCVSL